MPTAKDKVVEQHFPYAISQREISGGEVIG
jgi:hypothetical protein